MSAAAAVPLSEWLLDEASARSAIIARNLREYGDAPLSQVLGELCADGRPGLQPRDDLWEAVRAQAKSYYGAEAAADAVAALRAEPLLITSNHFGIDTLAVSMHCTLLFALRPSVGGPPRTAVGLGCGSVSMDSLSYPMGLLLYDYRRGGSARLTHRLPVLPNRLRRWMVGSVGPFDERMVRRARDRLRALRKSGDISLFCARAAGEVLEGDLGDADVLSLPTYRHQATAVNGRLWSRVVDRPPAVRVVQLELEEVTTALLVGDLHDQAGLLHRIMFVPSVRAGLLSVLDGARACWHLDGLRRGMGRPVRDVPARDGTVFFWGLGEDGRRIPLLVEERGSVPVLTGVDRRGRRREWDFTPGGVATALTRGELLPSLITCFAVIAFARGVACVGGPYQAGYLPVMQRGIVEAIGRDDRRAAETVARVPTWLCIADMNVAMRVTTEGLGLPAGPLEIAGAGGLSEADLDRILTSITVREAYLAAFPDILPGIVPEGLPDDWLGALAAMNAAACPNIIRLRSDEPAS